MVAAIGFIMIIVIVALLLKGKMSPTVVLVVVPSIAALILGNVAVYNRYRSCVCARKGEELFRLGEGEISAQNISEPASGGAVILGKYKAETGWYEMLIGKQVMAENGPCTLVFAMDLQPVQRIVAYTTIDIAGERWIVNSTLPISELAEPLRTMFMTMTAVTILYLIAIGLILVWITAALSRAEAQKKEIRYLKEINRGMEAAARKNDEIRLG